MPGGYGSSKLLFPSGCCGIGRGCSRNLKRIPRKLVEQTGKFISKLDYVDARHHDVNMRTTIDINDAILRELKEHAKKHGFSLRAATEDILLAGLAVESKAQSIERFHVASHRMGVKPGFHGISLNQVYDQLEVEDDAAQP